MFDSTQLTEQNHRLTQVIQRVTSNYLDAHADARAAQNACDEMKAALAQAIKDREQARDIIHRLQAERSEYRDLLHDFHNDAANTLDRHRQLGEPEAEDFESEDDFDYDEDDDDFDEDE